MEKSHPKGRHLLWTGICMVGAGIFLIGSFIKNTLMANPDEALQNLVLGFFLAFTGLIMVAMSENLQSPSFPLPYIELNRLLKECEAKWDHWPEEYRECKRRELDKTMFRLVNLADINQLPPEYRIELKELSTRKNALFLRAA